MPNLLFRLAFSPALLAAAAASLPSLLLRKEGSAISLAKVFPFGKEFLSGIFLAKELLEGSSSAWGLLTPFAKGLGLAFSEGVPKHLGIPMESRETSEISFFSFLAGLPLASASLSARGESSLSFSLLARGKAGSSTSGFLSMSSRTSWMDKSSIAVNLLAQFLRPSPSLSLLIWKSKVPILSALMFVHTPPLHLESLHFGSSKTIWNTAFLMQLAWISPVLSNCTNPFIKGMFFSSPFGLAACVLDMAS